MGLSFLPLDFSLILSVASRLFPPYSTGNKTSRLMVKGFSTTSDTQRGSQSYMKKRRGRKEIEVSRRRPRGVQERRDRSRQYSVPQAFSAAQKTHIDSQNWIEKRRGREDIEVIWGRKRRVKRGRK